jgi:hypothetical protein
MSIIYNKLENDFTQISNTIVIDQNITATAFRLYSYMCYRIGANSHWDFFNHDIVKSIGVGRDALISAKNNLIQNGYLRKIGQSVKKDGTFGACDYEIFKTPITGKSLSVESQSENKSTNNTYISKDIYKESNTITNTVDKKNAVIQKQQDYLSLPEWQSFSEYEKQKIIQYINQRKEDHGKTIKNTPKAIKPILSAILELKSKDLTIDDIMANIQDKNGCVYQTIKVNYFDNVIKQKKTQNNTNSHQNEQSYQDTQNNAPKPALNDDKKSDDYFVYRFNEDIYVGFSFPECNELTRFIENKYPNDKKVARILALIEWLKNKPNHELTQGIKKDIIDIYNSGGYDIFVKEAIKNNPQSNWVELLDLLF